MPNINAWVVSLSEDNVGNVVADHTHEAVKGQKIQKIKVIIFLTDVDLFILQSIYSGKTTYQHLQKKKIYINSYYHYFSLIVNLS